jgi:hypothetical protein
MGSGSAFAPQFRIARIALVAAVATILSVGFSLTIGVAEAATTVVRVNAGGANYGDSAGQSWAADCCNSGGNTYSSSAPIAGTSDPTLYQSERWNTGPFTYTFSGLAAGSYTVTLKFAEIAYLPPGRRQFNVAINGTQVLTNFDVAAQVGWNTALDKTFSASVGSTGQLTVGFTQGASNYPIVSAIQVVPASGDPPSGGGSSGGSSSGGSSGSDPSGEPMPVGNVTVGGQAWRQVYADNFPSSENTPLGGYCGDPNGFPHKLSNWYAYPYPWRGTPNWATYCPERTTSVHDGVMDIWLHSESVAGVMQHLITAPLPRVAGAPLYSGQVYGRYAVRYQEPTAFPMFHVSWLLWPDSNYWPQDGEIDFPENDTDSSKTGAYLHWLGASVGTQQDPYEPLVPFAGPWHTAVIDWLPSRVTFYLDGQVIGNTTDTWKITNRPLHWILQTNGSSFVAGPDNTSQGHIYIDWLTMYAPG